MKIIFLDIDGPLVNHKSHSEAGKLGGLMSDFGAESVKLLSSICTRFDAKIVVISTWASARGKDRTLEAFTKADLAKYLHPENWAFSDQEITKTSREKAILKWMNDNQVNQNNIVIIDDEQSSYTTLTDRLVAVDRKNGFVRADSISVERLLTKTPQIGKDI